MAAYAPQAVVFDPARQGPAPLLDPIAQRCAGALRRAAGCGVGRCSGCLHLFRPVPSASDASDADAAPGVCGLPGADAAAGSVLFVPHSAAGVFAVRAASSGEPLSVDFISDDRKGNRGQRYDFSGFCNSENRVIFVSGIRHKSEPTMKTRRFWSLCLILSALLLGSCAVHRPPGPRPPRPPHEAPPPPHHGPERPGKKHKKPKPPKPPKPPRHDDRPDRW